MKNMPSFESQTDIVREDVSDFEVGQCYWYEDEKNGPGPALYVLSEVMSNGVELRLPIGDGRGYSVCRMLFRDAYTKLKHEPSPNKVLDQNLESLQSDIAQLTDELSSASDRLLGKRSGGGLSSSNLPVISSATNIGDYQKQLIEYKEVLVPRIQGEIKEKKLSLSRALETKSMIAELSIADTKDYVDAVSKQIEIVSLYAGVGENVISILDGEPAPATEKLHVFQSLMHMDEQCLVGYQSGGMDIQNIGAFDEWLSKQENLNRVLPFPKCAVVFKVRGRMKEYYGQGSDILDDYVSLSMAKANEMTFLYIRNGEKLSRLDFEGFDFGDRLFGGAVNLASEELYFSEFAGNIREFITKRDYDERLRGEQETLEKEREWFRQNPFDVWCKDRGLEFSDDKSEWLAKDRWKSSNPHYDKWYSGIAREYTKFSPETVYYDKAIKKLKSEFDSFNKVAMIFQGIIDRSDALSPFPAVALNTLEGVQSALVLIDEERTLYNGDKPDLYSFINEVNRDSQVGDRFSGVIDLWLERQREKKYGVSRHTNGAPPEVVTATKVGRKYISFEWQYMGGALCDEVRTAKFKAPINRVLNIDRYESGALSRFYSDPRTRREYLSWAPLLMVAENYCVND